MKESKRSQKRKGSTRRKPKAKPIVAPLAVIRAGETTIRRYSNRRFVQFGEFRGKKIARVEFYTCSPNYHSIALYFQDRTVFYLKITPLFAIKPEYCSLRTGDVETMKEWPEMKPER
jgi:hypothetical protein